MEAQPAGRAQQASCHLCMSSMLPHAAALLPAHTVLQSKAGVGPTLPAVCACVAFAGLHLCIWCMACNQTAHSRMRQGLGLIRKDGSYLVTPAVISSQHCSRWLVCSCACFGQPWAMIASGMTLLCACSGKKADLHRQTLAEGFCCSLSV